ncbi:hypothetical protein Btru_055000 [Bulinus truncatus]|nr:hypothetical protein Btru_055000 [Bulinus truncatus]
MDKDRLKPHTGKLKDHFGFKVNRDGQVIDADRIVCCHCRKVFAYHGSNTSLRYHLQKIHSTEYQKLQSKEQLDACPQNVKPEIPTRASMRQNHSLKPTDEKQNLPVTNTKAADGPTTSDHVTSSSASSYNAADDCRVFGEFVVSELRSLKSESNRRLLKRMIQRLILEVSESDDLDSGPHHLSSQLLSPFGRERLNGGNGVISTTVSARHDAPQTDPLAVAPPLTVHVSEDDMCVKYEVDSD